MDADGTDVRQLSDVVGSDWAFVRVDWSHDGTKIVGQAGAADNIAEWDIWVINADGSGATNVGAHAGGDEIIPSWAPDRDCTDMVGGTKRIVLLEEGAEPVDLPGEGGGLWSPDGQLLYGPTDAGIVVRDLDGTVQMTDRRPRRRCCLATAVRVAQSWRGLPATAPSPRSRPRLDVVVGEVVSARARSPG